MAEYKASAREGQRANYLEKARDRMIADFKLQKDKLSKEGSVNLNMDKFISKDLWADNELKKQTVGLVQLEDFQKIKEGITKRQREEEKRCSWAGNSKEQKKVKRRVVVSFNEEELFGGSGEEEFVKVKVKKNPGIDTSFLPDRERDEKEEIERNKLRQEWIDEQDKIKAEKIQITCSYWDGTGHRKVVECKKGDTIAKFLERCSRQWTELRGISTDDLMYVKEDVIIPQHYTFYDFIANKVRGKSGPLFSFDVHDDVRLLNDATIETDESHAGKVIRRSWYEKNKHIFPASRWEVFDPRKDYGSFYGIVEDDLYRGSYPAERNYPFLKSLGLKTLVSVTPESLDQKLLEFCNSNSIKSYHLRAKSPDDKIPLTYNKLSQILVLLSNAALRPMYVHCTDGLRVTGIIFMCFRKLQNWSIVSITNECSRYTRTGGVGREDVEFVMKFSKDFEHLNQQNYSRS